MPKVNEIFLSFKIDLAKGEHLNFSSLRAHFVSRGVAQYIWFDPEKQNLLNM